MVKFGERLAAEMVIEWKVCSWPVNFPLSTVNNHSMHPSSSTLPHAKHPV